MHLTQSVGMRTGSIHTTNLAYYLKGYCHNGLTHSEHGQAQTGIEFRS